MIERRTQQLSAFLVGWPVEDVDGTGPARVLPSRVGRQVPHYLRCAMWFPDDGVSLEVSENESPADARGDFLSALGLSVEVFLPVRGCGLVR